MKGNKNDLQIQNEKLVGLVILFYLFLYEFATVRQ